jgi:hypothetical protein
MREVDVWRSAHQFIKMHGVDAAVMAAQRADALLSAGDVDGFHAWQRIVVAINDLCSTSPHSGKPTH